jgi:electron transfer flavoprotein alpha subunit
MTGGILLVAELKGTELAPITKQVVGAARKMADEKNLSVSAIAIGKGIGETANTLIKLGVDSVFICDSPEVEDFIDESYAKLPPISARYRPKLLWARVSSARSCSPVWPRY